MRNGNVLYAIFALFIATLGLTACSDGQSLDDVQPDDVPAGQVRILLHFDLLPATEVPPSLELTGYHFPAGKPDEANTVPFTCSVADVNSLTCTLVVPESREVHFMVQMVNAYGKQIAVCTSTDWQSCGGFIQAALPATGDKPEIILAPDANLNGGVAYITLIPRSHL